MSTTNPNTPETAYGTVPDLTPSSHIMRKILVPTDFSDESYAALRHALGMAKQSGGEILLVHVVEPIHPFPVNNLTHSAGDLPPDPAFNMGEDAQNLLARVGEEAATKSDIPVQTALRIGRAYDQIVQAAKDNTVDLIVIPTHGYTGLKHVLLGSTAERVVRHATCPVLVLRCSEGSCA